MTVASKLEAIRVRVAAFSGWNLVVNVECGQVKFRDPDDVSIGRQSWLFVALDKHGCLYEVYGRLRHWGVSLEDRMALREVLEASQQCLPPSDASMPVPTLDWGTTRS